VPLIKQYLAVNKAVQRARTAKKGNRFAAAVVGTPRIGQEAYHCLWLALKLRNDPQAG